MHTPTNILKIRNGLVPGALYKYSLFVNPCTGLVHVTIGLIWTKTFLPKLFWFNNLKIEENQSVPELMMRFGFLQWRIIFLLIFESATKKRSEFISLSLQLNVVNHWCYTIYNMNSWCKPKIWKVYALRLQKYSDKNLEVESRTNHNL